jgi:threonyl-tRNA synthetase
MSITIQFPDGNSQEYDSPTTPLQIARGISEGLGRVAIAAELDGRQIDLSTQIQDGSYTLRILTPHDPESLEVLRHTAAHIMAQAVRNLYGDKVQYTIGPALTDDFQYGFYYDFDLPDSVSADDFGKIEAEMKKIAKARTPLERTELTPAEAKQQMLAIGQEYKIEMIDDLLAADENLDTISFYRQGDFVDMCRGPHLPDTSKLKAFKLLTLAGSYWRGDVNNKTLTRIYGTAFFDKKELAAHIERIAEAKKRDHRILGKQLGLFALSDEVGPGLPLWLPKGTIIRMELEGWLRAQLLRRGYQAVMTPHIGRLDLYRTSGHYPYYEHGLFPVLPIGEDEGYLLKPMNCPHHIQVYKASQRSYRELPLRFSEFGTVYRFEKSGDLNGLTRVRGFTQDDAHIFCSPEQLEAEIASCVELTKLVLDTLGLNEYRVRIGLRDRDSSKYVGSSENWEVAEQNIRNVVRDIGLDYTEETGEAAFYGPKIDFVINDCIGREWQLGTIQVDYNLPERFGLEYVGSDNTPHRPIMIHRAPLGSPERFIGILIEHFAGAFPLWLAPVQVAVLPVSEKCADYAADQARKLKDSGIRAELDDSPEKIGAKIRRATLDKVPYMLIVGQQEADARTVSVRHRTEGDFGSVGIDEFISDINAEIETKGSQCVANRLLEKEDR